mgnify:CR=1 FL=1
MYVCECVSDIFHEAIDIIWDANLEEKEEETNERAEQNRTEHLQEAIAS